MAFEASVLRVDRELSWKAKVSTVVLLLAWLYAFSQEISVLFQSWQAPTEHHIPIIFLLIIGALIHCFPKLKSLTPNSSQLGLVLLMVVSGLWVYAKIQSMQWLDLAMVLSFIPILILICNGANVFFALKLPLFYVIFLFPWGTLLFPTGQAYLYDGCVSALQWMGMQFKDHELYTMVAENELSKQAIFPAMEWLIASFAIGCYVAFVLRLRFSLKLLILAMFSIVPVVVQCIVALLILGLFTPEMPFGLISLKVGSWIFFLLTLGCAGYFSWQLKQAASGTGTRLGWHHHVDFKHFRWFKPTLVSTLVILSLPWIADNLIYNPWRSQGVVVYQSKKIPHWSGPYLALDGFWQPQVSHTTATQHVLYRQQEKELELFAAYFDNSDSKVSIYNSTVKLYRTDEWQVVSRRTKTITIDNESAMNVSEEVLHRGQRQRVLWHWYFMGEVQTPSLNLLLLLERLRSISDFATESGVIAISTEVNTSIEDSQQVLTDFLVQFYPELHGLMHPPRSLN